MVSWTVDRRPSTQHDQPEHEEQVGDDLAGGAGRGGGVHPHAGIRPHRVRATQERQVRRRVARAHGQPADASGMTQPTTPKNTNAFFLQSGLAFAIALLAMLFAIYYMPADPWIRAFLSLGTIFLVTSSFSLAKCIRDAQEENQVLARLDRMRLEQRARRARPVQGRLTSRPATVTPARSGPERGGPVWETPPRAAPGPGSRRAGRRVGLGQVHLGERALPRRRRSCRPTRCAASSAAASTTSTRRPTPSPCSRPWSPRGSAGGSPRSSTRSGSDAERRRCLAGRGAVGRAAGRRGRADHPGRRCRRRNAARDRPVPAPVLAGQLARVPGARTSCDREGWDQVVELDAGRGARGGRPAGHRHRSRATPTAARRRASRSCSRCPASRGARTRCAWLRRHRPGGRRGRVRRARA